eukprot:scaffold16421_cov51-Attheya_sp.AAC.4
MGTKDKASLDASLKASFSVVFPPLSWRAGCLQPTRGVVRRLGRVGAHIGALARQDVDDTERCRFRGRPVH